MSALGPPNLSPTVVVDPAGRGVADPSSFLLDGLQTLRSDRLLWALPMGQSGLQRYLPHHDPSERCNFGIDFSMVVPFGVGLATPSLTILINTAAGADGTADWVVGPLAVRGRAIYAQLSGGTVGTDYQLRWSCADTLGNNWVRFALVLCAHVS